MYVNSLEYPKIQDRIIGVMDAAYFVIAVRISVPACHHKCQARTPDLLACTVAKNLKSVKSMISRPNLILN